MERKTATSGRFAGQDFLGCSQFAVNGCRGRIHLGAPVRDAARAKGAGGSAQARFDLERRRYQQKVRAAVPFLTAVGLIMMAIVYLSGAQLAPGVGAVAAAITGVAWIAILIRLPPDALFWDKGARGERRTAEFLEPLIARGFVVLHDRLIPGSRANIDHVVVGPTGVFVVETKNLTGTVEVIQDRLLVSDRLRSKYVEETYREAFAAQVALHEHLEPLRITVVPVLCIHGARMPWFDHAVQGVRLVSGSGLARLVGDGPRVLADDQVQKIAAIADRRLRAPNSWERE